MDTFLIIGACLFWIFMINPELDRLYLKKFQSRYLIAQGIGDYLVILFFLYQFVRLLMFIQSVFIK